MTLLSIGGCLAHWARKKPHDMAIVADDGAATWRDLDLTSNRLARSYREMGVRAGDFVSIALPNGLEFYQALFAVWKLGATPQPISWRMPPIERDAILDLVKPALVVGAPADGFRSIPPGFASSGETPDAALEDCVPRYWKAVASGGSTGRPKVIVTARPGLFDPEQPGYRMQVGGAQLVAGPLYHNAALIFSSLGLFAGNRIVVMARFDPERVLELVERHHIDWMVLVPTMMSRIWKLAPEVRAQYRLDSIRTLLHTGAACPAFVKRGWIDWIGPDAVLEGYGGTEGNGATLVTGTQWLQRPGTVGTAPEGWEVRIVDEAGAPCAPGTVGEIQMREIDQDEPPYFYVGAQSPRRGGGWESLGDMGHLDDAGFLFVADRRTDMIVSGGANIYPAEVEAAIESFPGVRASAVIGLPDGDLGNRVHAIVDSPMPIDEQALRAHLADRLVSYKLPRSFEFLDQPLRNEAGKMRRSALRDERLEPAASGIGAADHHR